MKEAIIVTECDDINQYFLVIDRETGNEIRRFSTEKDFDTWRFDEGYDEDVIIQKIVDLLNIENYNVIHW